MVFAGFLLIFLSCFCQNSVEASVEQEQYAVTKDGFSVVRYTLVNENGAKIRILNYGGIVSELWMPDRNGELGDVVLGYDRFDQYEDENPYFGCITGRVANRIAFGRFQLDGVKYELAVNNGPNHLHGGLKGFDKVIWDAEVITRSEGVALGLSYTSPDGEEGYPGNLNVRVTYILSPENNFIIEYEAETDRPTPINLTNHSYFNLAGDGDILGHILTLKARYFTEPDHTLIPTGRLLPVSGSSLDFTKPASVGGRIAQVDIGGYDHNYVLDNGGRDEPGLAAELYDPESGRVMTVYTTEPGVQLYSGIHLDGLKGKHGALYNRYHGLCLETQHFPDSINQSGFPSIVLRPGEKFRSVTSHNFTTR